MKHTLGLQICTHNYFAFYTWCSWETLQCLQHSIQAFSNCTFKYQEFYKCCQKVEKWKCCGHGWLVSKGTRSHQDFSSYCQNQLHQEQDFLSLLKDSETAGHLPIFAFSKMDPWRQCTALSVSLMFSPGKIFSFLKIPMDFTYNLQKYFNIKLL